MLKLGVINYFHSAPFFGGNAILGSPKELKAKLDLGELDVSFVSAIHYIRNKKRLTLLPRIGIGAENEVESVRLFYPQDMDHIDDRIILLDPESETANLLLKWLLKRRWRGTPHLLSHDLVDDYTRYPHILIGDIGLSHTPPKGFTSIDLGAWWRSETGLPFLFAPLVARPTIAPSVLEALQESLAGAVLAHPPVGKITHLLDDRYLAALTHFEKEIQHEL